MMDKKYLAEIKAQCKAVEDSRYGRAGKSYEIASWKLKANVLTYIPALLAEVENSHRELAAKDQQIATLAAENQQNAAYADTYKDICDKYGKNFRALLDKAKALQAENATLEKALEIVAELYGKATGDTWNPESTVHDFIFMAEHPEQAQEGKR